MNLIKLWLKYNKYIPVIEAVVDAVKAIIDAVKKNDPVAIDYAALMLRDAVYDIIPESIQKVATKEEVGEFATSIDDTVRAVIKTVKTGVKLFRL